MFGAAKVAIHDFEPAIPAHPIFNTNVKRKSELNLMPRFTQNTTNTRNQTNCKQQESIRIILIMNGDNGDDDTALLSLLEKHPFNLAQIKLILSRQST